MMVVSKHKCLNPSTITYIKDIHLNLAVEATQAPMQIVKISYSISNLLTPPSRKNKAYYSITLSK